MVNDIRLYIDNELVEFKTTPEIYYNWTETDFTNPVVTKNSYSKTITVEGTKQNNKIFGHFWNLERYQLYGGNTGVDFNPSYKVPFTLYVDGNLFEKGYVKLQKVSKKNGVYQYEIGLFGGLGTFLYNLSVNEDDGSIKTFNSLNFYMDNELVDFGFNIDKDVVKTAWDNIDNSGSKWYTLNFSPAYTGIPDKFDANKVLINFNGYSASTLPQNITDSNKNYTPQAGCYAIGELSDAIDGWQVKDLRSYMQIPVLRVKSIFDALQRKENSKGKFDEGFEVVLDNEFFNNNNPYYADSFVSLPKITTLSFTTDSGETQTITASTSTTTTDYSRYGATENTTITFTLPETVNNGGIKAKITYYRYDTVTRGNTHPDVQALNLQPTWMEWYGSRLMWRSENRTALGAQLLAVSNNDSILNGSDIAWYTSLNYDGVYFSCGDAINYGTYVPKYPSSDISKRTGYYTFVETAATGSIYSFTPIELEVDLPAGTSKVQLNLQRCAEKGEGDEVMVGTKLYPYGYHDTPETTCYGTFNSSRSSGTTDEIFGGSVDNNFYSHRYVKQNELFTTDYSVSDWLISYCKMFGLYIHKDLVEDKIYVDTRNTYYKKDSVEDISELIDYSKDFTINPVYISNKFYTLTSPMEKTKYSETYKNTNGEQYGMKLINTGFEFEANRKELLDNYKLKTGIPVNRQDIYNFKPISGINPYVYNGFTYKLYQNGDIAYENTYDVEIPKKQISTVFANQFFDNGYPYYDAFYKMCFENEGKEVNPSSVLLFYNGNKNVSGDGYYLTDDLGIMSKLNNNPCWIMTKTEATTAGTEVGISLTEIPLFSSYYAPYGHIVFSSNFGSPRELYTRQDELKNHDESTLYYQFYKKYYEDLFDINTKVVECYVKPKYILNGENLRKFYWFNNSIWRLNKITDYSPVENRTVKCQFIKIQDLNNISNEIPSTALTMAVTLDKYTAKPTGETINGHVYTSDYLGWSFEGSEIEGLTVTPSSFNTACDIQVYIPRFDAYGVSARTITLVFSAGDISVGVTVTQNSVTFMEASPQGNPPYIIDGETQVILYTVNCNPGCTVKLTDSGGTVLDSQHYDAGIFRNRTFYIGKNIGSTPKTYYFKAISDKAGIQDISWTVTHQNSEPYFKWSDYQTSALTVNVGSASTSTTKSYTTNYTGLTFTKDAMINSIIEGTNQITANYDANPTSSDRTGNVYVKSGNTEVGRLTIIQDALSSAFTSNLRVNGSLSNVTIGSGTTGFTISTTPSQSYSYDIYVNDTKITSTTGDYTSVYNCGANPNTTSRTFIVKTIFNTTVETLTVTQSEKYLPTRTIRLTANNQETIWNVNMYHSGVIAGQDIDFHINKDNASGTIMGQTYGDTTGTYPATMEGSISWTTTDLTQHTVTITLEVGSSGPRCTCDPYSGNSYGFGGGEIGGGAGSFQTTGTVTIPAGAANSTTVVDLINMTWELG